MRCKKCGAEIHEGCLFCYNCGEAVQIVPDFNPELEDILNNVIEDSSSKDEDGNDWSFDEDTKEEDVTKIPEKTSKLKGWFKEICKGSNLLWLLCIAVILAGIFSFMMMYGAVIENQDEEVLQTTPEETVNTDVVVDGPVFGLPEGTYTFFAQVRLSSETGTIYYTVDGTTPSESSIKYTDPIELTEGVTVIRALVIDGDGNASEEKSQIYTVELTTPDNPVISPASGEYTGEQFISIDVPEGCVAYYTMDASDPSENSSLYTEPILMPYGDTFFYGILKDDNGSVSGITQMHYICTEMQE